MISAKRESDGEIVDAQGDPGDEQPTELLLVCIGRRVRCPCIGPPGLDERVCAGGDKQATAYPVRGVSEGAGQAVPEGQAQDRHTGFEDPEYHADAHASPGVDTGDADADRGAEVG